MQNVSIREKCHVNTNRDSDTFVGIRCIDGDFSVNFPLGFHVNEEDKGLRKDILMLISTIAVTIGKKESTVAQERANNFDAGFPIQSHIYLIYDFLSRGYYRERESHYNTGIHGKINWSKTIKTQKPYIQDDTAFYLEFVTKENFVTDNELISLIYEYCVYESFQKLGWLFTASMPRKPRIKYNKKQFIEVVSFKYRQTFNDRNKRLFRNMLAILQEEFDPEAPLNFRYGTNRFEYVWEALIDKVFGIEGKTVYFPKTQWILPEQQFDNASLEPDSIMLWQDKIYVLDAKYYKYGATRRPSDLPESTSINKQITYGEYIAETLLNGEDVVYNAFLMPFDAMAPMWGGATNLMSIGKAISNWKSNEKMYGKKYEKIQGILVDVKYLMGISVKNDETEIAKLASCIEQAMRIEV